MNGIYISSNIIQTYKGLGRKSYVECLQSLLKKKTNCKMTSQRQDTYFFVSHCNSTCWSSGMILALCARSRL